MTKKTPHTVEPRLLWFTVGSQPLLQSWFGGFSRDKFGSTVHVHAHFDVYVGIKVDAHVARMMCDV